MNTKSQTLFHFTKNIDILKSILKYGFWPRYCSEDVRWLGYPGFNSVAYPMVCFCDIPLSKIEEHVEFYGYFGIGMTKHWSLRNSLTPVLYFSEPSLLKSTLVNIANAIGKGSSDERAEIRYLLAYSKPTEGEMIVDGKLVSKEFYLESEWRCVPRHSAIKDCLDEKEFDDDNARKDNDRSAGNNCSLTIEPSDVKYVFVKSDADIPNIVNFIQTELDHFPSASLKILMSRVVSLESICSDL